MNLILVRDTIHNNSGLITMTQHIYTQMILKNNNKAIPDAYGKCHIAEPVMAKSDRDDEEN